MHIENLISGRIILSIYEKMSTSKPTLSERAVEEKIPWILLILVMVLTGVAGHLLIYFGGTAKSPFCELGGQVNYAQPITLAPFLIFLAWPLTKLDYFKGKITPRLLGYIYIAIVFITYASSCQYLQSWQAFLLSRFEDPVESLRYVPSIMAPPADICLQFMTGKNLPIPWDVWLPRIVFWWFWYTMPVLFLMSIDTLFRRHWIDVERLPVPHTLIAYEAIVQTTSTVHTPSSERVTLSPFFIGLILGAVFNVPLVMIKFFPWFPDIYGWYVQSCCAGGVWHVVPSDPLAAVVGFSTLQKNPLQISIAYLIPQKILFNAWFWWVVYVILMQIAYYMGYYTGIESIGGCGRAWCSPTTGLMGPPLKFHAVSLVGGLIGIVILTIWEARSHLLMTLKAAIGRLGRNQISEMESEEAMSYRSIWLMVILTSIGFVLVFLVEGMSLEAALVMLLTCFVFQVACIRMYGLSGINPLSYEHGQALYRLLMWPTPPNPPTIDYVLAQLPARQSMCCGTPHADGIGGGMFSGLAAYKMAQLTGIRNRDAFKITLISFLIMPIIAFLIFLWVGYTFGLFNLAFMFRGRYMFRNYALNTTTWNHIPAEEPWVVHALIGMVVTVLLGVLHSRFIWFPFEPIGFICGTTYVSVLFGMWFPFLVAWILKTLTLRIGGSRLYEQYGVPIAVGFTLGCMALTVLNGIISVYYCFHPF
jgi:hypothetical protein